MSAFAAWCWLFALLSTGALIWYGVIRLVMALL
jgi:hypothetical protein